MTVTNVTAGADSSETGIRAIPPLRGRYRLNPLAHHPSRPPKKLGSFELD